MARRGLVSKGMGQGGGSGGSSALMPKGEKPKGPDLVPVAEVARRLRVDPEQVEAWVKKNQLRGNSAGIRTYDFEKFKFDYPEEIRKAQQEALQEKDTKSARKPKKGILSKFKSIFGGEKGEGGAASDGSLVRENQRLKAELQRLQKAKSGKSSSSDSSELEEKVRYLETKLSETRALESEVASLRKQLAEQPEPAYHSSVPQPDHQATERLERQLSELQNELADARRQSQQGERFREALTIANQERDQLLSTIAELRAQGDSGASGADELARLQDSLTRTEHELSYLREQSNRMAAENEQLRVQAQSTPAPAPPQESPLVDELLQLQRRNLERFKRLHALHQQAQSELGGGASAEELEQLQAKYDSLLADQKNSVPQEDVIRQLSESREFIVSLKSENQALQSELKKGKQAEDSARVRELEEKLREAQRSGHDQQQVETELNSLRKGMESKENQLQKVASKLADNEKRLSKAMQESARLTELLIERENRLREISEEFEQEYRDKLENLDRQVSGLQWKLSLREERIAHLESELQRKG